MKIKNLREQKNLTQSYMAERLDISQNTYSKIETGGIKLTVDRLKQISEILQESVESILSQDNHGKLCLYGAGLAGKDLGLYFKQSGGVAFDIGSIFDHWIGKQTRGKGKGRNGCANIFQY